MKRQRSFLLFCLAFIASVAVAHEGMQHIMGTVNQFSADSITVKTTKGALVTVAIAADTKFMKDKATAKLEDLKVGDKVVIHAKQDEKDATKLVAQLVMIGPTDVTAHHGVRE